LFINWHISHIVKWLSERCYYFWRMYRPTLLKLFGIFMKCFCVNLQNYLTKFSYYYNYSLDYHRVNVITSTLARIEKSTNLHDNIILIYNQYIKISNDFKKAVLHIVPKWIHLIHSYMTKICFSMWRMCSPAEMLHILNIA